MKRLFRTVFLGFFMLGSFSLSAQVLSRSGFPAPQESRSWLRSFPCGGEEIFRERFEADSLPAGWQALKLDTGTVHRNIAADFDPGWQSVKDFKDPSNRAVASPSWYNSDTIPADNWLITPAIKLSKNTCLSWTAYSQDLYFQEAYEVRISTTTPSPDSMGFLANSPLAEISGESGDYNFRSLSLADYDTQTVYLAFRQTSLSKFALVIDDVRLAMVEKMDIGVFQTEDFDISLGDSVMIQGAIRNYGLDSVDLGADVEIAMRINGDSVGASTLFTDSAKVRIAPNDTVQFQLPVFWKPSEDGVYYICLYSIWAPDEDARNDSSCIRVGVGIDITDIQDSFDELPVKLYPNPFTSKLSLIWEAQNQNLGLTLFDLHGRQLRVQSIPAGSSEYTMDLDLLPSGIYFLQFEDNQGLRFREKVVKY